MVPLQNAKWVKSIVPQSVNDTDTNGTSVDTAGFKYAIAVFHFGAIGAADVTTLAVQDSADDSSFAAVTAFTFTAPTQTDDNKFCVAFIQCNKYRRYLRWNCDPGAAATLMTGFVILTNEDVGASTDTLRGVLQSKVG